MLVDAYIRVSTQEQTKGEGLSVQRKAVRDWCKANGHKLRVIHEEPGISGSNGLESREALPNALCAIRDGETQGLILFKLDRLARDVIFQETIVRDVRAMGGEIFSTSAAENDVLTDDEADPSRKMIRTILGAVNQYEKEMIVLRMKMGINSAKAAGRKGTGSYAYGYEGSGESSRREAVAKADEQATVARIAELRKDDRSYREIAATLDAEGHKPRRAQSWSAMAVRNVAVREGVA